MRNLSISSQRETPRQKSLAATFNEGIELTAAQVQRPRQVVSQQPTDVQISISPGTSDSTERPLEGTANFKKQARFLRKACVVLFSSFLWSALALDGPAIEARIDNLMLIACGFFVYSTFSNIFFCLTQNLTLDHFEENLLEVLEGFLSLCFLFVLVFLRQRNESKYLLVGSVCVYLLLTSLFVKKFRNKRRKIFRKLAFTIQIALVTAKILGYLPFNWLGIFVPLGLYLIAHQTYGSYRLIKSLIKFSKQVNNDEIDCPWFIKNAIQITWLLFYNGLGSLALAIMISLCQQADKEPNEGFMKTVLAITEYYSSFFLGYTLIFFKLAKDFNLDLSEEEPLSPTKSSIRQKGFYLKPQRVPVVSYFTKISATYFSKIGHEEKDEEEGLVRRSLGMEEDHPCYICETNEADIILLDCGHGGICKECVLLSMKKNHNCMNCRRPVHSIYQIEKEIESTRMVKAREVYSVIY